MEIALTRAISFIQFWDFFFLFALTDQGEVGIKKLPAHLDVILIY